MSNERNIATSKSFIYNSISRLRKGNCSLVSNKDESNLKYVSWILLSEDICLEGIVILFILLRNTPKGFTAFIWILWYKRIVLILGISRSTKISAYTDATVRKSHGKKIKIQISIKMNYIILPGVPTTQVNLHLFGMRSSITNRNSFEMPFFCYWIKERMADYY